MSHSRQSPVVLWAFLMVSIALESCCCHAQGADNSTDRSSQDGHEWKMYKKKRVLVERINLFLVTLPCLLLFALVFAYYTLIYKQQRLHGWIMLAITGSLFLRFGVIFLIDLPVFYFGWSSKISFYGLCVLYGTCKSCFRYLPSTV